MSIYSIKAVKSTVLTLFIITLVGCGGGNTSFSGNNDSGTTTTTTSDSGTDVFTGTGTASLSWTPPTRYTDSSALTLGGHYIYMNAGSGFRRIGSLSNPSVSDYLVEKLTAGTYTFAITAFDSKGIESAFSNQSTVVISS